MHFLSVKRRVCQIFYILCFSRSLNSSPGGFKGLHLLFLYFFTSFRKSFCRKNYACRLVGANVKTLRNGGHFRIAQVFYSHKFFRKKPGALFADVRNFQKNRNNIFFCTKCLIATCGKTVRFVTNTL